MSIRPQFAEAIANGTKKFEYRRQIFARVVETVVVYATKPVGMAIGEFKVIEVLCQRIDELWSSTYRHGGIDEEYFRAYFSGKKVGYAIKVGKFRRYNEPYEIESVLGVRPPQSFLYIL